MTLTNLPKVMAISKQQSWDLNSSNLLPDPGLLTRSGLAGGDA